MSVRTSTPCPICKSNPFVSNKKWEGKQMVGDLPREEWKEARCKGYPNPHEPVTYIINNETLAIESKKPPAGQGQLAFSSKRKAEEVNDVAEAIKRIEHEIGGGQIANVNTMFLRLKEQYDELSVELVDIKVGIAQILNALSTINCSEPLKNELLKKPKSKGSEH